MVNCYFIVPYYFRGKARKEAPTNSPNVLRKPIFLRNCFNRNGFINSVDGSTRKSCFFIVPHYFKQNARKEPPLQYWKGTWENLFSWEMVLSKDFIKFKQIDQWMLYDFFTRNPIVLQLQYLYKILCVALCKLVISLWSRVYYFIPCLCTYGYGYFWVCVCIDLCWRSCVPFLLLWVNKVQCISVYALFSGDRLNYCVLRICAFYVVGHDVCQYNCFHPPFFHIKEFWSWKLYINVSWPASDNLLMLAVTESLC